MWSSGEGSKRVSRTLNWSSWEEEETVEGDGRVEVEDDMVGMMGFYSRADRV